MTAAPDFCWTCGDTFAARAALDAHQLVTGHELDQPDHPLHHRKETPVDFRTALNSVIADLTPQPWDYTDNADTTLTVIPAGLREDPGCAEVIVRIKAISQFFDANAGIPSRDMPAMIDALTGNRLWSYDTDDVWAELTPFGGGGMILTVTEDLEDDDAPQIHIPEAQRLPLASALRRALDVARSWES